MWNKWLSTVGEPANEAAGYPHGSYLIDPWDYCAVKCRTQAFMTVHENAFRHAGFPYCFGELDAPGLTPLWTNEELVTRLQGFQKHMHMPKDIPTPGRSYLHDWSEDFKEFGHSADFTTTERAPGIEPSYFDRYAPFDQFSGAYVPRTKSSRMWSSYASFVNHLFPQWSRRNPRMLPVLIACAAMVIVAITAIFTVLYMAVASLLLGHWAALELEGGRIRIMRIMR